jgi:hypothetical protein
MRARSWRLTGGDSLTRIFLYENDQSKRKYQQEHQARRRLGMSDTLGSVPPRAARRLAASRAIRASSPACTRAIFSLIPVSSLARSSSLSSMIKVVRICIDYVYLSIVSARPSCGYGRTGKRAARRFCFNRWLRMNSAIAIGTMTK